MNKKIIIIGKAASGKDFFQKKLISNGWKSLKQYTTRPLRPLEVGDEYHFVTEDEFKIISDSLMSIQIFNGWKYGFSIEEAIESDVMIFSPANLLSIRSEKDERCTKLLNDSIIIYLDIDENTRRDRLSKRYAGGIEDDSTERRLQADMNDFKFFDNECLNWDENSDKYVRLCNKNEVDDFLKKLLS